MPTGSPQITPVFACSAESSGEYFPLSEKSRVLQEMSELGRPAIKASRGAVRSNPAAVRIIQSGGGERERDTPGGPLKASDSRTLGAGRYWTS